MWEREVYSMKTHYEVRFTIYQYNSGKADNGWYVKCKKFEANKMIEAIEFAEKIKWLALNKMSDESVELAEDYAWSGFVSSFDGLYQIQTEEMQINL